MSHPRTAFGHVVNEYGRAMTGTEPSRRGHAQWITHGERSIYESKWMKVHLVDVEAPGSTTLHLDAHVG